MYVFSAELLINQLGIFFGNQALPIETDYFYLFVCFHSAVAFKPLLVSVVFQSNDTGKSFNAKIINHNHAVWSGDFNAVNAGSARQHQPVVSIKLGEFALSDRHIHHDSAPDLLI